MVDAKWTIRLSHLALRLGVAAFLVALFGVLLARYDLVPKTVGLFALLGGVLIAFAGVLAGVAGAGLNLKYKTQTLRTALIGLLLSGGYAGYMASRAHVASGVPGIHDITTDLANPPTFAHLSLRADNLAGVETLQNWRTLHARAYADLKPLTIAKPVATVLSNAERLARKQGWEIVAVDAAAGQLEATASVSFIRYKDDVVVLVVPTQDGQGSLVDMRSVSRIGVSDLGVNAKRIRAFLAALAAA